MARKNRSNNSFAPIVITVLVAGVVGYYLVINSMLLLSCGNSMLMSTHQIVL